MKRWTDTRPVIAEYIESELLAVLDLLPTNVDASTYGKPTRYMAEALLAKLYLNWAVYTSPDVAAYTPNMSNPKLNNVVAMCDDIIESGKFDLSDPYLSKFYPENGPHIKSFIYVMPFDRETQQGMTYAAFGLTGVATRSSTVWLPAWGQLRVQPGVRG